MAAADSARPRDGCDLCGRSADTLHQATVVDDSGGAFARLCDTCWNRLQASRCAVCGDRGNVRNYDLVNHAPTADTKGSVPVCASCRRRIIRNDVEVPIR